MFKMKYGSLLTGSVLLLGLSTAQAAEYEWKFQASETSGEPSFKIKQEWAEKS